MSYGLEVYDSNGSVTLSLTDRIGRVLGSIVSGTSAGSAVIQGLSTGAPFFILRAEELSMTLEPPTVTVSGTTLSWTFFDPTLTQRTSATIFYGVY